jgi:hypothetical protein|tara:strand:+ start:21324 stop:22937 length:1614 start_codon:yes stop_codon:yes gene_type:complete
MTIKEINQMRRDSGDETAFTNLSRDDAGFRDYVQFMEGRLGDDINSFEKARMPTKLMDKYYGEKRVTPENNRAESLHRTQKIYDESQQRKEGMFGDFVEGSKDKVLDVLEGAMGGVQEFFSDAQAGERFKQSFAPSDVRGKRQAGLNKPGFDIGDITGMGGDILSGGLGALGAGVGGIAIPVAGAPIGAGIGFGIGEVARQNIGELMGVREAQPQEFGEIGEQAVLGLGAEFGLGILAKLMRPFTKVLPRKVISRLIRPGAKELEFGKDPALAIAREGITANTMRGLQAGVNKRKSEIGKQIGERTLQFSRGKKAPQIDISSAVAPIDDALRKAKGLPRENAALIKRLEDLKQDLLEQGTVYVPHGVWEKKSFLSESMRWAEDTDNIMNKVKKKVYSKLDKMHDDAVPGIKELNSRYADLAGAKTALKRRIAQMERSGVGVMDIGLAMLGGTLGQEGGVPEWAEYFILPLTVRALRNPAVRTRYAAALARNPLARDYVRSNITPMLEVAERVAVMELLESLEPEELSPLGIDQPTRL